MARAVTQSKWPLRGSGGRRGACLLWGSFTLGAAGALSVADGFLPITTTAGTFGVIKTATKTGRYSLFFDRKYRTMRVVGLTIQGAADAAIGNTAGNMVFCRNLAARGKAAQSFDIQLALASSGADTDGANGTVVSYIVAVEEYGGPS
jgi:hypothetical protein